MKTFPLNADVRALSHIFKINGYSLYIVGGAVRDFLLGNKIQDFDFTTDAKPQQVMRLFSRTIPTGLKHGTVTVLFHGHSYEVTTFRTDEGYSDGRHPDKVSFVPSLEEDLKRRDFTINALAADMESGKIIDLHEGIQDLKRKSIRAIGESRQRFTEDGLRIMRACRFASCLGFDIEQGTFNAMEACRDNLKNVSKERIREEFYKLLMGKQARKGLQLMLDSHVMNQVLPEIAELAGIEQGGFHHEDVLEHTLSAVDVATQLDYPLPVRIAALLHDIGKKETQQEDAARSQEDGRKAYSFHGHELVSERKAHTILRRLKDSNEQIDLVCNLVRNHMFHYTPDWSDGAVRRFINRVGRSNLDYLYQLRMCDAKAIDNRANWSCIGELEQRVSALLERNEALTLSDLAVNGKDLMEAGIPAGPAMGQVLQQLLETVLDDPAQNTKGTLLGIATAYYATYLA
ncbi:MAG: CCA tRNA nucleotidyltransferase [Spirochaetia bacterium]|jgi:tRNA nucleotidyltransferase/poly(A) polymerase|nr:CCA tRNA nucleotidyltransferase [Spirochaetia bacterium]